MAERLIDAEALTQAISKGLVGLRAYEGRRMVEIVADCIVNAPTIEAKPIIYAHWEEIANGFMVCSHCKESVEENRKYSYCPICGAQMDEFASDNNVGTKEPISQAHENGVKVPVINMEDVPKIMEEIK